MFILFIYCALLIDIVVSRCHLYFWGDSNKSNNDSDSALCRPHKLLHCVTSMRKFFQCDKLQKSLVTTFVTRHIEKIFSLRTYALLLYSPYLYCVTVCLHI